MSRATIDKLCQKIASERSRFGLRRGATPQQQAAFKQKLQDQGVQLPAPLLQVWGHFNGCAHGIDGDYRLLSLSEILREKQSLDRLHQQGHFADWQPGTWWNPGWLPLAWFEGDLLCLDVTGTLIKPRGQVFEFRASSPSRSILYRSLESWLEALVALLESAPTPTSDYSAYRHSRQAKQLLKKLAPGYPIPRAAAPVRRPVEKSVRATMRSFERGAYRWRIERRGCTVLIAYGRGYSVSQRRKQFADAASAAQYMQRAAQAKIAEGYSLVPNSTYL